MFNFLLYMYGAYVLPIFWRGGFVPAYSYVGTGQSYRIYDWNVSFSKHSYISEPNSHACTRAHVCAALFVMHVKGAIIIK